MHQAFKVHRLNSIGMNKAHVIGEHFDHLLEHLQLLCPPGPKMNIVATKLEEACFFAKKAMASDPVNTEPENPT